MGNGSTTGSRSSGWRKKDFSLSLLKASTNTFLEEEEEREREREREKDRQNWRGRGAKRGRGRIGPSFLSL